MKIRKEIKQQQQKTPRSLTLTFTASAEATNSNICRQHDVAKKWDKTNSKCHYQTHTHIAARTYTRTLHPHNLPNAAENYCNCCRGKKMKKRRKKTSKT